VVGDHRTGRITLFPQKLAYQPDRSALVALALHQNVEHFALSIDGTPQIDQPAIDFDEYLVKMPSGMRLGPASSKVSCDHGTEVFHPAPHRLIGDDNAAFSQDQLNIS